MDPNSTPEQNKQQAASTPSQVPTSTPAQAQTPLAAMPTTAAVETPQAPLQSSTGAAAQATTSGNASEPSNDGKKRGGHAIKSVLVVLVGLLLLGGAGYGGYAYGYPLGTAAQKKADDAKKVPPLTLPSDATLIAQCAKGRGAQYARPGDIPLGPVYNFYQGKVIGLEFMLGQDDLIKSNKNYLGLPLFGQNFLRMNVGLLSQGHAGYPQPHYHVDVFNVPASVTDAITCK